MYINIKINRLTLALLVVLAILSGCMVMMSGGEAAMPVTYPNAEADTVELPIIMYHSILKDKARHGNYVISPDEFESDLKYINANGYTTVTINDLLLYTQGKASLPKRPIMLTFDDGYYNNYLYAFPLLKKYNCKAVISIIGRYTDEFSKTPDENAYYSHCTWDNLNEMLSSGLVELQNHTYDLHSNTGGRMGSNKKKSESNEQYKKMLTNDVKKLQDRFKSELKITPTAFAYPFGAIAKGEVDILKEMDFKCTLTCTQKVNYITSQPSSLYDLGRFLRPSGKSIEKILIN